MIKAALFSQAIAKLKAHLPDLEMRTKIEKVLQECAIVTQAELDQQLKQIEKMQTQVALLEARLELLEKAPAA